MSTCSVSIVIHGIKSLTALYLLIIYLNDYHQMAVPCVKNYRLSFFVDNKHLLQRHSRLSLKDTPPKQLVPSLITGSMAPSAHAQMKLPLLFRAVSVRCGQLIWAETSSYSSVFVMQGNVCTSRSYIYPISVYSSQYNLSLGIL